MALVKIKPFAIGGAFLVIVGTATLIHRSFMMPAQREVTGVGGEQVITETRRIVRIPVLASSVLIICGCGLFFLSTREVPR